MVNNEFGDFQTPLALAVQCLRVLGLAGDGRVLEPTCGRGSFLQAAATLCPGSERAGLELRREYAAEASRWASVRVGNVFETHLARDITWRSSRHLAVVGNPPWVTSAELNRMDSKNIPAKENFKGAKGIDALLGSSNFDVCEFIMLKILNEYRGEPFTLGMLCKTQVVRNVISHAAGAGLPIVRAAVYRIDAMKWFGAGVDACWFVAEVDPGKSPHYVVDVRDDLFESEAPVHSRFGVIDGLLVADVDRYLAVRAADGVCPYEWRSGIKHDAAGVFELRATPNPANRLGEPLELEADYVFPFVKSTDVFRGRHRELTKWVVIPQRKFGAETDSLEFLAPNLWAYLTAHAEVLDGRKSAIYRNRPRFSIFGHGDYTFAPYKVAISGLHKEPVFRLLRPTAGKPVVLDDTCYLLAFDDATEAAVVTAVLNSEQCASLIQSLVFWDSKRPVTKRLLARIDLNRLPVDWDHICERASSYAAEAGVIFDAGAAAALVGRLGHTGATAPS